MNLQQKYDDQQFTNEYELVNGVAMHTENPEYFHIPPDVIKRHVKPNQFVELRIDSLGFSMQITSPPSHEQHEEMIEWRGTFDIEVFDAKKATKEMRKAK